VQSLFVAGLIEPDQTNQIGAELWLENHRSLNDRYGDPVPEKLEYTFTGIEAPLDPAVVLKQVDCYNYQSCEGEARWLNSAALELMELLHEKLIAQDGVDRRVDGLWGIDRLEQAVLQ
jgi:hypothetical protein